MGGHNGGKGEDREMNIRTVSCVYVIEKLREVNGYRGGGPSGGEDRKIEWSRRKL